MWFGDLGQAGVEEPVVDAGKEWVAGRQSKPTNSGEKITC